MQRYVFALCALVLVAVNLVAGEGGPLDSLGGKRAPAAGDTSTPVAAEPSSAASPGASGSPQMALGSDFGIGDYDAGTGEGAEDDGGYGEPTMPAAPAANFADNSSSAKWNVPDGSLTDEQLGVEKPTGLVPLEIQGA